MQEKYKWLKTLVGISRFYGGLTFVVAVFAALSDVGRGSGMIIFAPLVGGFVAVAFFAFAEFIEMAISARHDLDDIRFYLSTTSKPRPNSDQLTEDSPTQATDEKTE